MVRRQHSARCQLSQRKKKFLLFIPMKNFPHHADTYANCNTNCKLTTPRERQGNAEQTRQSTRRTEHLPEELKDSTSRWIGSR